MTKVKINKEELDLSDKACNFLAELLIQEKSQLSSIPIVVEKTIVGYTTKNIAEAIKKDLQLLE